MTAVINEPQRNATPAYHNHGGGKGKGGRRRNYGNDNGSNNYRYGGGWNGWYYNEQKQGNKRPSDDSSPQPLKVPPVCLAELDLKQVLDSSDSPDPLAPVSHPRRWDQMVTYFTPRLCRVGSGVQPRACRHDAYVDLATAPPERVDSDEQLRHMAQAADSTHSLAGTPGLPDTVLAAVNFLRRVGLQNVKGLRESAIAYWSDRAVVLADEAAKVSASMPDNLRRIAGHLNIPLFKEMLHASHYPDEGLADDLIHGLCLHGSFGPLEGVFRTIPECVIHMTKATDICCE
ncbi:hypothetical protein FOZ63_007644 [Perkinsus olseni]|uniref:Uncharacterized protein n=1 Tax=Perkinsus olseni TaxID=32597 RepID=A0A7J6TVX8_PEROL|nr:hypothetical protein FOZ63_007644 [Perkinsus olseni]